MEDRREVRRDVKGGRDGGGDDDDVGGSSAEDELLLRDEKRGVPANRDGWVSTP